MPSTRQHNWPICPATGKQRLRERQEVGKALTSAKYSRNTAQANGYESTWRVVRGYRCEFCNGFHLTGLPTWVDHTNGASSARKGK